MDLLQNIVIDILALIVTLVILVTIHEFGHFWVARRCNVKVESFSIGFGKTLLSWRKGETIYKISALPFGGYVKMLGEGGEGGEGGESGEYKEIDEADKPRAFNNKPLYQRTLIVAAGPAANFILAVFLYWLMLVSGVSGVAPIIGSVVEDSPAAHAGLLANTEIVEIDGVSTHTWQEVYLQLADRMGETGSINITSKAQNSPALQVSSIPISQWLGDDDEPNILGSLGLTPFQIAVPAQLGEIISGGSAEQAGLLTGDLINSVNGEMIDDWFHWVEIIRTNPETDLSISVLREGENKQLILRPAFNIDDNGESRGYIGAGVQTPQIPEYLNREVSYSLLAAIPRAFQETKDKTVFVFNSIKKIIMGLLSVKNLSGPITIAQIAGETAIEGFEYYLGFLAILSISLGVFNLLPIPMVDGGHLLYFLIEAVTRRPVPERVQAMGMQLGILLIVGLTFIVFYNDLNRLF